MARPPLSTTPPPRTLALSAPGLSPGRSAGREHKSEAHGEPIFLPFFFFWRGLGALAGGAVITHVPQGKREKAVAGRATPLPPRLQISSLPRFSACGEGGCPKDSDPHPARVLTWGLAGALLQGKWNNLFSIL